MPRQNSHAIEHLPAPRVPPAREFFVPQKAGLLIVGARLTRIILFLNLEAFLGCNYAIMIQIIMVESRQGFGRPTACIVGHCDLPITVL